MSNIRVFARQALGDRNVLDILALIDAAIDGSVGENHIANKNNPHEVTKAQVGLGNVDNTADIDKVVLSASKLTTPRLINGVEFDGSSDVTISAIDSTPRIAVSEKGAINGVASLNESGIVPATQLGVGTVAYLSTNSSTENFLRGDGVWVTPPDTTYSEISEGEITAGTSSELRTITARRLKYLTDNHTHTWSQVTGKPTTLSGYGITDGVLNSDSRLTTNLSYTASSRVLASSTGTNVTLPEATTSVPGLLSAADKTKITQIDSLLLGKANSSHTHTAADLPTASTSAPGIVQLANVLTSTSTTQALTAAKGKELSDAINNINSILASDDTTLDEIQEIVNYIKQNRSTLDSLSIGNIAGLQAALDGCVKTGDSRLTNSREWSASTMSQAEAEAGTATTRRAVNALVMRKGVEAYTEPFTSAEKTKLNGIAAGAQVNVPTNLGIGGSGNTLTVTSSTGSNVNLRLATASLSGLMSLEQFNTIAALGNVANINTNASTANFLRGDGTWVTPPNTTYSEIPEAEITAGTSGTARVITARRLAFAMANHDHTWAQVTGKPTTLSGYGITDAVANNDSRLSTNLSATNGTTAGPTIVSSTGTNVVIPTATTSVSGIVTTTTQSFAGNKTFTGTVNAATFNATSTTGGGFQGIDADTAAAPSFTWTADLDTGIYRPAADTIGFTCGGTQRAYINANGYYGAGANITSLNASNLASGTVPNARLTGTYDGITVKLNGANTMYTSPSSGTQSDLGRTVYGLAEYRNGLSNAKGAIAFIAPSNATLVMMQFEIAVMLYSSPEVVHITLQGYRSSATAFTHTRRISKGTVDIQVRFAYDSAGRTCVILGDVGTVWSYPHVSIIRAMLSHNGANDAYCSGWTTALLTSLTGYTLTGNIVDSPMVGSITGSASSVSSTLSRGTGLTGNNFNGSAATTWAVAYGTAAGTACQGNDSRLTTNLGYTASTRVLTSSTGSNVTLPQVTTSADGLMIAADKTKLNGIAAGAQVNVATNLGITGTGDTRTITSSTGSNVTIPVATASLAGIMSRGMVNTVNAIGTNANRNLTISTGNPSGGSDGDVWYKY